MIKRLSYIVILGLLLIPFLQLATKFIEVEPLDGAYTYQKRPAFDLGAVWAGDFQRQFTKYFDDHIGFRPHLVRSYNQLHYSCFNVAKSPGCVVGKDGQLFIRSYIDNYSGSNFVGDQVIDRQLDKLRYVRDVFRSNGTELLLVFAPGKASFYPEAIPDRYLSKANEMTNQRYWSLGAQEWGLSSIDLNEHFQQIKGKTPYPLYNKNGVHWTRYGAYLGADTIARFIERSENVKLPTMTLEGVTMTDQTIDPDNDVEVTMNLFKEITQPDQPHIELSFREGAASVKPKVLMISDSYYWPIFAEEIPQNMFSPGGFWFYFKTSQPENKAIEEYDIKARLLEQDVIILMGTEATMHLFPYGFVEEAYELFRLKDSQSLIDSKIEKIDNDKEWSKSIEQKAKNKGVTYEHQVLQDAIYMKDQVLKTMSPKELEMLNFIDETIQDDSVMQLLKAQAEREKTQVEFLIREKAIEKVGQE